MDKVAYKDYLKVKKIKDQLKVLTIHKASLEKQYKTSMGEIVKKNRLKDE